MTATQPIASLPESRLTPAHEHRLDVLLACAATGDETAFMRIYDLTANCVYGLALRLLQEPTDAEDVAVAAYQEIWSRSKCFDSTRHSAAAWIMATAHIHIVALLQIRAKQEQLQFHQSDGTHARRTSGRPGLYSVVGLELHYGPHERADSRSQAAASRAALAVVPAAHPGAPVLASLDGLTVTDGAVLAGAPSEAAAFRKRAGLTQLRLIVGSR